MVEATVIPTRQPSYIGIPYNLIEEALNLPHGNVAPLDKIYEVLVHQGRVNPYLEQIKHGMQSPSTIVSGHLPRIVNTYIKEKERIMPLVLEVDLSPKDFAKLTEAEQKSAKDHNDLRKTCMVRVLKEKAVIPDEFMKLTPNKLIDVIINVGGLKPFAAKYHVALSKGEEQAAAIAKNVFSNKPKRRRASTRLRMRTRTPRKSFQGGSSSHAQRVNGNKRNHSYRSR